MKGLLGEANSDLARRSMGPSLLSFDMVVIEGLLMAAFMATYMRARHEHGGGGRRRLLALGKEKS